MPDLERKHLPRRGYFGDPEGHLPDVETTMRRSGLWMAEFEQVVAQAMAANPDKDWTHEERVQVILEWMKSKNSDPKP